VFRGASGGTIENVYREELTFRPFDMITMKFLGRYQDIPRTTNDVDPYIITDYISSDNTDEYVRNVDIDGGVNADVWTLSAGIRFDFTEWLAAEEIIERTNDYDVFPQYGLNDAVMRDLGNVRDLQYFLNTQGEIAVPPYDDYTILKSRVFFRPMEGVRTKFEYVLNNYKHATGRDDNISHYGFEIDVDFMKNLRGSFKFIRSQVVDLFQQVSDMTDLPFNNHTNIFRSLSRGTAVPHVISSQVDKSNIQLIRSN